MLRQLLGFLEVASVLVLTIAAMVAVKIPTMRDEFTVVAAVSLAAAFVGLLYRRRVGLLTYFALVVVVMPAISYWGFMYFGNSRVMASTSSLVVATYVQMSTFFLSAYLAVFLASLCKLSSVPILDLTVIRSGIDWGKNERRWMTRTFAVISIVAAYIYQPSIPGGSYAEIEYNLLAGSAWNYVCLIAYVLLIPAARKGVVEWVALIGVPIWLILHFDRADILGLFLLWFLYLEARAGQRQSKGVRLRIVAATLIGGMTLLGFAYLGLIRSKGLVWDGSTWILAAESLFNYSTVQAANHAFMAAIEYVDRVGHVFLFGEYPVRMIPSFLKLHPSSAEVVVQQAVGSWFGMHIGGEFYLNFGLAGAVVAVPVAILLIATAAWATHMAFGREGLWLWYAVTVLMVVRIGWYGLFYYLKAMTLLVPCFLLLRVGMRCVAGSLGRVGPRDADRKPQSLS